MSDDSVFDWRAAPSPWNTLGPEIAAELRRIAAGEEPREIIGGANRELGRGNPNQWTLPQ